MTTDARFSVCSVDDMLALVRSRFPDADRVVVSWERRARRVSVLSVFAGGELVDLSPDSLASFSSMLKLPFSVDVWRLAFPGSDAFVSSAGTIDIDVDVPLWARVVENVASLVEQGLRVSDDDLRDACWLGLEQAFAVAPLSMRLVRRTAFVEAPDEPVFEPASVTFLPGAAAGEVVPWGVVSAGLPRPVPEMVTRMASELAERQQHAMFPEILAEVTITL